MLPTITVEPAQRTQPVSNDAGRVSRPPTRAEQVWATLAPRLAARGRVRVARDGRNYRRKHERRVTGTLPSQPAAVLVYDDNGCAPVFVVDLDAKGPEPTVERDYVALIALLEAAGLTSWFSDHSPSGGRHLYVPVAGGIPFTEARDASRMLEHRLTSADKLPMSGISEGCIRPPGSVHRTGGHQVLDCTLEHAVAVLESPNSPQAWDRFTAELQRHHGPLPAPAASPIEMVDDDTRLDPLPGYTTAPSDNFQAIARTGDYDTTRYASPSEARQAVLWASAASGWRLVDVARRIEDGTWPGLASFYARYSAGHRHKALSRDWQRALSFEKRRRESHRDNSVRLRTTSPHKTQRGERPGSAIVQRPAAISQWIREWLAAVDFLHGPETHLGVRAVLYALAEAAALTQSRVVEHGNRSLAIATGLDHSSVGRVLRLLEDQPSDRLLLQIVRRAKGVHAHAYELRIPPLLAPKCAEKPWRAGRIHAIRPVFRDLGLPAAFVYAALEQVRHRGEASIGGRELARLARVGVTSTYEALQTLATHGLAERVPPDQGGGWRLGDASLAQLAESWGITDAIRAQMARYRAERAIWRHWLTTRGRLDPRLLADGEQAAQDPDPPPRLARGSDQPVDPAPPWFDDTTSLLELLERELGAVAV